MSCKAISPMGDHASVIVVQSSRNQKITVSDAQLIEFAAAHTSEEIEIQHRYYTEQRDSLDLTQLSPERGLNWLASLPGEVFFGGGVAQKGAWHLPPPLSLLPTRLQSRKTSCKKIITWLSNYPKLFAMT